MAESVTQTSQLPPAGPAWAGSLMGTSIAATLSHLHGFDWLSRALLAAATILFVVFTVSWVRRRNPQFAQEYMGPWGMTSMGILALGSAWTGCTGHWGAQILSWVVATPLAVAVCLWQLRKFHGAPSFPWGLALVSPMVAATSGGQIAQVVDASWSGFFHGVGVACFLLSLVTGVPVFVRVYADVVRGRLHLPATFAGTAWIPLGIVGQSTAAAQLLFPHGVAHAYGLVMFTLGVPALAYAAYRFWPAALRWAEYSPGWWGSTFPAGTLSLGSWLMGWHTLSAVFLGLLLVHWAACAVRFLTR